jgi:hypothetical protein
MAVIDETQGQDRGAFLTAYNSGFKDFVEDVRGLTPTPDANDAHQRFLTAIENTSTLLIEIEASAATTPGPTADEEFDQFTRSEALFGEVSAACSDLVQAIGRTPDALCFPD